MGITNTEVIYSRVEKSGDPKSMRDDFFGEIRLQIFIGD